MSAKNLIIEDLQDAKYLLKSALIRLKTENIDGQFDYCTSSELSSITDDVMELVKDIEKIVYQK